MVVLAFVAINVFTHQAVQDLAGWLGEQLTIDRLTWYVTVGGTGFAVATLVFVASRLRGHPEAALVGGYLALTTALVVLAYNTLFLINTEAIHFPQYALLGMLVYPLVGRVVESVAWVTLFGAVDEAWQYWWLNAGVDFAYFDFNDVVINLLGGALGVLLLMVVWGESLERTSGDYGWWQCARSWPLWIVLRVTVFGFVLGVIGLLSVFPSEEATIVLMQSGPREAYWETSYWGKTAHVLLPAEGVSLIFALLALYLPLDARVRLQLTPLALDPDPQADHGTASGTHP